MISLDPTLGFSSPPPPDPRERVHCLRSRFARFTATEKKTSQLRRELGVQDFKEISREFWKRRERENTWIRELEKKTILSPSHHRDTKYIHTIEGTTPAGFKKCQTPRTPSQPCGRTLYRSRPSIQASKNLPYKMDWTKKDHNVRQTPYFPLTDIRPDSALNVDIYEYTYAMKVLNPGARRVSVAPLGCKGTNI